LVVCFFARNIYTPKTVLQVLANSGMLYNSEDDLRDLGGKILIEKYKFKLREGYNVLEATVPKRALTAPNALKREISEDFIKNSVHCYMDLVK